MTRRITIIVSVIAILAFLFGIWAFNLKIIATKAGKEADKQKNEALVQKQKADQNRLAALDAKSLAENAKDSAEKSKEIALEQEKNAVVQKGIAQMESAHAKVEKNNAERSAQEAEESKKVALTNADIAERNRQEAEKNKLKAITEKEKAERLQKLAESKNEAHKAVIFMNDSDYKNSLKLSLTAYNNNLANDGDFQDDDIYGALYLSWQNSIQDKNYVTDHNAPVRSLAGMPHSDIVFSGDENGLIIVSQNNKGVLTKKSQTKVGGEIRSLMVDPGGNYLLVVLLKGAMLYKINNDHSLQKFTTVKYTGYGRHGAFLDNKHFLVQSTMGVVRFEISEHPAMADSVNIPNCEAIAVGKDGKIFVAAARDIFEYSAWDAISKAPINTFTLPSHVTSICLDKSEGYLAAGTYAGGIWFKDLNSKAAPFQAVIHHSAVNDIKFCEVATGRLQLASASSDRTIKLIEVNNNQTLNTDNLITITDHTNWVYSLAYSPDGKYLFSGGEDKLVAGRPSTMTFIYNALTNNK